MISGVPHQLPVVPILSAVAPLRPLAPILSLAVRVGVSAAVGGATANQVPASVSPAAKCARSLSTET